MVSQRGSRESEWASLMRAATAGDEAAYRRLLQSLASALRTMVRRGLARFGAGTDDAEDVVQEALLAIHLKRQTWDPREPIEPWVAAIARHKMIDHLRRKGRRVEVDLESLADVLPSADPEPEAAISRMQIQRCVETIGGVSGAIVQAVSIEGASIKDVAARFQMNEGAVRVALHRGLKRLANLYGNGTVKA